MGRRVVAAVILGSIGLVGAVAAVPVRDMPPGYTVPGGTPRFGWLPIWSPALDVHPLWTPNVEAFLGQIWFANWPLWIAQQSIALIVGGCLLGWMVRRERRRTATARG